MKLTTRGHYSVKAFGLQPKYGPVSVKVIATRQDIPALPGETAN